MQTTLHFQQRFASLLAEVPGCESLVDDPRFSTRESRQEHLDDYVTLVRRAVATRPSAEWLTLLASVGIPASRIQRIDDAVAHPQLAHRAGTVELDLPALGRQAVLTAPFRFDGQRKTTTAPPPTLGEHTGRVLRDVLGYDDDRIGALSAQGAFGDHEVT